MIRGAIDTLDLRARAAVLTCLLWIARQLHLASLSFLRVARWLVRPLVILIPLLVSVPASAATICLNFTAPSTYADVTYCGVPDSAFVDPFTGQLLEGSPMNSLQSIRLYGYLFKPGPWGPEPALRDTVDARGREGQPLTICFEAPPGSMGFVWLTATNVGLESCALGGYTFAIPAVDSTVEASYELIWRKP